MFIKRILYPVTALGPGKRVGIWVAGCSRRCPGCISPELWSRKNASDLSAREVMEILDRIPGKIEGITISGGEPMDQPEQLLALVTMIRQRYTEDIIVYTGYRMEELWADGQDVCKDILRQIAVLIDGPYMDDRNDGVGLRGSDNQHIWVLNPSAGDYAGLDTQKRSLQTFVYHDRILMIGIQ